MNERTSRRTGITIVLGLLVAVASPARGEESIRDLKLKDWHPKSMLVVKQTQIQKPSAPVFDVHNHLGAGKEQLDEDTVRRYLQAMDDGGVRCVVNLDGGWGDDLKETLHALDKRYPSRFLTFALVNFEGVDEPGWTERETERLRDSFEAGAKGLKIHKSLGLDYLDENGRRLPIDDERLDPIWSVCGAYKKPVMIHSADPAAFFTALDGTNERWHELNRHPEWSFHGGTYPTREELLRQRNRVFAKHPDTTFIGAHFGNSPENLAKVGQWLDAYPNFYVDIDARINELGRQPYTARRFFLKYQDRILFGTDLTPNVEAYRICYRFLETDDEYWDTAGTIGHRQGFWMVYGIFLPKPVLQKIYWTNANKLFSP